MKNNTPNPASPCNATCTRVSQPSIHPISPTQPATHHSSRDRPTDQSSQGERRETPTRHRTLPNLPSERTRPGSCTTPFPASFFLALFDRTDPSSCRPQAWRCSACCVRCGSGPPVRPPPLFPLSPPALMGVPMGVWVFIWYACRGERKGVPLWVVGVVDGWFGCAVPCLPGFGRWCCPDSMGGGGRGWLGLGIWEVWICAGGREGSKEPCAFPLSALIGRFGCRDR
ncbi:uncharacterized protein B0H64DRAFT_224717 [Chaetomium fimeti]|uniref:Uncharacterized protein n=1 Tax=Chaetomium fimeti TaxID=1854472 RepID=A0AAE0LP50_9PEZI|nr:hypothetical protein B0H64DRAFT_224717 [Chaetomium fimeti]